MDERDLMDALVLYCSLRGGEFIVSQILIIYVYIYIYYIYTQYQRIHATYCRFVRRLMFFALFTALLKIRTILLSLDMTTVLNANGRRHC